mgnify:CR=1 FL=1
MFLVSIRFWEMFLLIEVMIEELSCSVISVR